MNGSSDRCDAYQNCELDLALAKELTQRVAAAETSAFAYTMAAKSHDALDSLVPQKLRSSPGKFAWGVSTRRVMLPSMKVVAIGAGKWGTNILNTLHELGNLAHRRTG
ncbi:MAG: hypothetical protein R2688_10350 [Fimbriimonadaceae bacterium]